MAQKAELAKMARMMSDDDEDNDDLRIVAWNVNGIRNPTHHPPWRGRLLNHMFDILKADIVVLQETKIQRKDLEDYMVLVDGFDCYWSWPRQQKGYAGVVVYTRTAKCAPIRVEEGLTGLLTGPNATTSYRDLPTTQQIGGYPDAQQLAELTTTPLDVDSEGRCVVLEFPAFVLLGTYTPATRDDTRTDFKADFHRLLDARIRNLVDMGKRVICTGDLNVTGAVVDDAYAESDQIKGTHDPTTWMAHPPRRLFNQLVHGYEVQGRPDPGRQVRVMYDLGRYFHSGRRKMYTCWDIKKDARPANYGTRLDYVLCSQDMITWFKASDIQPGLYGSDHCPVYAVVNERVKQYRHGLAGLTHILDLMNPAGMFVEGVRQRPWTKANILPLSGRLFPEFAGRRNIRDMFASQPAAPPPPQRIPLAPPRPLPSVIEYYAGPDQLHGTTMTLTEYLNRHHHRPAATTTATTTATATATMTTTRPTTTKASSGSQTLKDMWSRPSPWVTQTSTDAVGDVNDFGFDPNPSRTAPIMRPSNHDFVAYHAVHGRAHRMDDTAAGRRGDPASQEDVAANFGFDPPPTTTTHHPSTTTTTQHRDEIPETPPREADSPAAGTSSSSSSVIVVSARPVPRRIANPPTHDNVHAHATHRPDDQAGETRDDDDDNNNDDDHHDDNDDDASVREISPPPGSGGRVVRAARDASADDDDDASVRESSPSMWAVAASRRNAAREAVIRRLAAARRSHPNASSLTSTRSADTRGHNVMPVPVDDDSSDGGSLPEIPYRSEPAPAQAPAPAPYLVDSVPQRNFNPSQEGPVSTAPHLGTDPATFQDFLTRRHAGLTASGYTTTDSHGVPVSSRWMDVPNDASGGSSTVAQYPAYQVTTGHPPVTMNASSIVTEAATAAPVAAASGGGSGSKRRTTAKGSSSSPSSSLSSSVPTKRSKNAQALRYHQQQQVLLTDFLTNTTHSPVVTPEGNTPDATFDPVEIDGESVVIADSQPPSERDPSPILPYGEDAAAISYETGHVRALNEMAEEQARGYYPELDEEEEIDVGGSHIFSPSAMGYHFGGPPSSQPPPHQPGYNVPPHVYTGYPPWSSQATSQATDFAQVIAEEEASHPSSSVSDAIEEANQVRNSWNKLFARPVVPKCEHGEPCKTMLTKKPGVNRGRSFWMCVRPLGPSGKAEKGTEWRCNTFIWCSEWDTRNGGRGSGSG